MAKAKVKVPTARKLPSGNWFVQLRLDGKSISITKPTEKEAIAEAMAIKSGIITKTASPLPPSGATRSPRETASRVS